MKNIKKKVLFFVCLLPFLSATAYADESDLKKVVSCAGFYQGYLEFRSEAGQGDKFAQLMDMRTHYLLYAMRQKDDLGSTVDVDALFDKTSKKHAAYLSGLSSDNQLVKYVDHNNKICDSYFEEVAGYVGYMLKMGIPYEQLFPSKAK